ncbi:MAG: AAA family ATPase [Candidatus Micrarchaeota archaeon]|nr:AAA family ATPase [Candidatus Micrarchaeota archaeon]
MPTTSKTGKVSSTASNGKATGNGKGKIQFGIRPKPKREQPSYKATPLYLYKFKDMLRQLVSAQNFPDAVAAIFALISVSAALPLFPIPALAILSLFTAIVTMLQPLIGLMVLLFTTFPMFLYQVPLIAWLFTLFMSMSFLLGYKHYRSIIFIYALLALPFSIFGWLLELPLFILTILTIGFKRGAVAAIVTILIVAMSSGLTGLQNSGGIVFSSNQTFSQVVSLHASPFLVPSKPAPDISSFSQSFGAAASMFFSYDVSSRIFQGLALAGMAIVTNLLVVGVQLLVWVFVAFMISTYAVRSRSKYKGTEASLFGAVIIVAYVALSYFSGQQVSMLPIASFFVAPPILFILEYNEITVVRALEVMKQDFRGRFGEMFEDITTGTKETFDDIANYDDVKKELKEAVLAPIEKRELAGAFNIKPAKGILLFGPPGTGKTFIMRALANELRAGFFYIKASQIISPYPGQSAQAISRIFDVAKKHAPAIIFIDEIDNIASSREIQESESGRQMLSTLLSELDGFQKIEGVVLVGATNVPQMLDPAIMRTGRMDKIIYMPLPNAAGRKKILEMYFRHLPVVEGIDYAKLAEITDRYSGADIKNLSENVAREAAEDSAGKGKVLKITMPDIVRIIKVTKPSTSLAQIDKYNTFRMDYERRTHQGAAVEIPQAVSVDQVVGMEEAKKALHEAVEVPILHPELLKKYDIKNIKGILLFGPPGTGKTMLMRAVVSEMGDVHLVTLSGAEISKYGPERAIEAIRQTFDRAKENAPAIIFIDEIDAVVPARDTASEKGMQFTGEFLEELDGLKSEFNIVLVGATNRPDMLDTALLRPGRIDKIIYTAPPNAEEREQIFRLNLEKVPIKGAIDFAKLSSMTQGYTGADIANICRQVKMNALEESLRQSEEAGVSMEMLSKLVENTKPSAPSLVVGRYLSFLAKYGQR